MASVNKVILIGNLGADPEVRYTQGGQPVASLRIATTEVWTDKEGARQERTEWHQISVWGKQAEHCGQYLSKGRQVYVEGRLQSREYTDKEGVNRKVWEIQADRVNFLGGGGGEGGGRGEGGGGGGGRAEGGGGWGGGNRGGGGGGNRGPGGRRRWPVRWRGSGRWRRRSPGGGGSAAAAVPRAAVGWGGGDAGPGARLRRRSDPVLSARGPPSADARGQYPGAASARPAPSR